MKLSKTFLIERRNIKYYFEIFILAIIILAMGRFAFIGTCYYFNTNSGIEENRIELGALQTGSYLSQIINVDGTYTWGRQSWGIKTFKDSDIDDSGGIVIFLLQDDKVLDQILVENIDVPEFGFIYPRLHFDRLGYGDAEIRFEPYGNCIVSLFTVKNTYDYGFIKFNNEIDPTRMLVQSFRLKYNNLDNKMAIVLFCICSLLIVLLYMYIINKKDYIKNYAVYFGLIAIFFCIAYIKNSEIFIEPVWAEAVTNYMHHAKFSPFFDALRISDANYLPLFERLVSIFFIKFFRIPVYVSLYLMQFWAVLFSGAFLSFFILSPFSNIARIEERFVIIILMMLQCSNYENVTFINYIIYGCYLFWFYLSDKGKWTKTVFSIIVIMAAMTCMSKGSFVVVLPASIIIIFLFYRELHYREKVYTLAILFSSLIQLLYSYWAGAFEYWGNNESMVGGSIHLVKLIVSSLKLFVNSLLGLTGDFSINFSKLSILLIVILIMCLLTLFIFFLKTRLDKKKITELYRNIIIYCIFLLGFSSFYTLVQYKVGRNYDIFTEDMLFYMNFGITDRYSTVLYVIAFAFLFAVLQLFGNNRKRYDILVSVLIFVMLLGNPEIDLNWPLFRYQHNGRINVREQFTDVSLLKGINLDNKKEMVIPILPYNWIYKIGQCDILLYGNNENVFSEYIEVEKDIDLTDGNLILQEPKDINQVFCLKSNLLKSEDYIIHLYNNDDKLVYEGKQSNANDRRLVNFTFENTIENVEHIKIIKENGDDTKIINTIYLVTPME